MKSNRKACSRLSYSFKSANFFFFFKIVALFQERGYFLRRSIEWSEFNRTRGRHLIRKTGVPRHNHTPAVSSRSHGGNMEPLFPLLVDPFERKWLTHFVRLLSVWSPWTIQVNENMLVWDIFETGSQMCFNDNKKKRRDIWNGRDFSHVDKDNKWNFTWVRRKLLLI